MLTLRKDVKLGLVIGGIIAGVVGVYLLLAAIGGGSRQVADAGPVTPEVAPEVQPNSAEARKPAPSVGAADPTPEPTADSKPAKVAPEATDDPWSAAFSSGTIKTNVTLTQNPMNRTTDPQVSQAALKSLNRNADGADAGTVRDQAASTPTQTSYEVQPGDTLSSIAQDLLGDARHYRLIAQANPNVDPHRIKPGVTLKIPPAPVVARTVNSDTIDVPVADDSKQYRIQVGDSLNSIASRLYGDSTKWDAIYQLNKAKIGDNPAKLKLGMILQLPEPPTVSTSQQ